MSERDEPSIDPQPGELGDGRVDVRGGTELAGGRDTGDGRMGTGPGGHTGGDPDQAQEQEGEEG